jgi:predicted nucleic acid-binding Zn ribbon protein
MDTPRTDEKQPVPDYRCHCSFCGAVIDVNLDVRERPYWVCVACQTRTFGTRTTLEQFLNVGLIWKDEPIAATLEVWWNKVAKAMGIKKKGKR